MFGSLLLSATKRVYSTWNPSSKSTGVTLSNANLSFAFSSSYNLCRATAGRSSGKWYWEITVGANQSDLTLGVCNASESTTAGNTWVGVSSNSWGWANFNGFLYTNNTAVTNVGTFSPGDVLGFALNMDAGTITFYKNGASVGSFSGLTGTIYPACGNFTATTGSGTANFGASAFAYTPPTGHTGLH